MIRLKRKCKRVRLNCQSQTNKKNNRMWPENWKLATWISMVDLLEQMHSKNQ